MQKVNIVCVGKIKESFFNEGVNEYLKRLSRFGKFEVIELPEKPDLKREAELILPKMKGYSIVLAVEGNMLSSEKLASKVKSLCDSGKEITFVIGSSCGLDNSVKNKADFLLSFSNMTFPHQLMRVILCEQIYRAFMINSNSEYHK